jgi:putative ABC transport system substrate-binding protein
MYELGWIDGRTVRLEYRATADAEQHRTMATELAALSPDVIVTGSAPVLAAAYRQTKSIPIVFMQVTDPVSDGFVASLARPGGNVTGFTIFEHSFAGKWLEMLKEVVPTMTRVAVVQNPDHPAWNAYVRAVREVASRMNVEVTPMPASSAAEVEIGLAAFGRTPNGGVILLPSPLVTTNRDMIAALALQQRLPSIYVTREYPESGGLMSYGIENSEPFRQAPSYVNRILKGAKPGDLPVQAATSFKMVINLKTAKALGISVPATMLGRADDVIE